MKHRPRLRILAVTFAFLLPALPTATASAVTATLELVASVRTMTYGDTVRVSGTVTADAACASGRRIHLEWRPIDTAGFATVAQGTAAEDGSFAFDQSQPHTGHYRAFLPSEGGCDQATSAEVRVGVRALVDAALVVSSSDAGSCVEVFATVSPGKPGQTVDLQRRGPGSWTTIETLALGQTSRGQGQPCLAWEDIGVVRYRVRWTAQDALNRTGTSPTLAFQVTEADWMRAIEDAIGRHAVSVSVSEEGTFRYRHADQAARTPASNEKLLLAMAELDTFGPEHRIETRAASTAFAGGVVRGNLWILGRGDPTVRRSSLAALAGELVDAGIVRVTGSVMGSTAYFQRDWSAPGWNDVARDYVNRPTALTFEGNVAPDPEREAAAALTKQLEKRGVRVGGTPGDGVPPGGLVDLASIESKPVRVLLARLLRPSWNFAAEVLGKGLAAEVRGTPGTIAKAAATIEAWVEERGVDVTLLDSSGLSYDNRVTAAGIVELLTQAEDEEWGDALRGALPTGGQGTLEDRLRGVRVRAKTGTLTDVSALSGWVYARQLDAWIEFSILSAGMSKPTASAIEDRIVRILEAQAR